MPEIKKLLKLPLILILIFLTLLNTCYCTSKKVKLPIFLVLHSEKKIKVKKETVEKLPI